MKYEMIRNNIRTGDIILFKGQSSFSKIIQSVTKSKYTHVGIAVNTGDYVLCLHSTKSNNGVSFDPLSSLVSLEDSDMYVRHLEEGLSKVQKEGITRIHEKYSNTPYEKNIKELLSAGARYLKWIAKSDDSSLFCSELITIIYQKINLIPFHEDPADFSPKSFSSGNKVDKIIRFNKLLPEIKIEK